MYNIRWKGHFGDSWTYYAGQQKNQDYTRDYFSASSSEHDVWVGALSWGDWDKHPDNYNIFIVTPSDGGQVDFQVEAITGYSTYVFVGNMMPLGAISYFNFTGEASGWSDIQTISIPEGSVSISTSPNPSSSNPTTAPTNTQASPTPSIPEFPSLAIPLMLAIMVVAAGLLVYHKRKR